MGSTTIDVSLDFSEDTPPGKDPDTFSPTLGRYHELLWSRPLPSGSPFRLIASRPPVYLYHRSELGEFWLSSDSVIHTYMTWGATREVCGQLPQEDRDQFLKTASTIGGRMVWPANKVDGKMTINGARGFIRSISDRFDLTVECVRRYYLGQDSPLGPTLKRYPEFFALFVDFKGFIDFFLLQDLVTDDHSTVGFFMSFDEFTGPVVPQDLTTYLDYRKKATDFVTSRNRRIVSLAMPE